MRIRTEQIYELNLPPYVQAKYEVRYQTGEETGGILIHRLISWKGDEGDWVRIDMPALLDVGSTREAFYTLVAVRDVGSDPGRAENIRIYLGQRLWSQAGAVKFP